MEWNSECTQLQLTCVTGAVQFTKCISKATNSPQRLYEQVGSAHILLYPNPSMVKEHTVASTSSSNREPGYEASSIYTHRQKLCMVRNPKLHS